MPEYRKLNLTVNPSLAAIVDPAAPDQPGRSNALIPSVYYGETVIFCIRFVDSQGNAVPGENSDHYELSIDCNFTHGTDNLMAYADHTKVNLAGDWDEAGHADGRISIRIGCATTAFASKIGSSEQLPCWIELKKISSDGQPSVLMLHRIIAKNVVHTDENEPDSATPGYYTAVQVAAMIAGLNEKILAANVYQFSANGSAWHDAFAGTDKYYRERKNVTGSSWGAALPLGRAEVIVDTVSHSFTTTAGQAAAITFTKTALGLASDSEPQLSLWSEAGGVRTQVNTASYTAAWSADSLTVTFYQAWAAGGWVLKFS